MKALFETAGLDVSEGGFTEAEVYAYSKGVEIVSAKLDAAAKAIFITRTDEPDLKRYAELLALETVRYTPQKLKEEIIFRMAHSYADYTFTDCLRAEGALRSGEYERDSYDTGYGVYYFFDELVFSNFEPRDLKEVGKFIKAYVHFATETVYSGEGMTFDEWEAFDNTFAEYDALCLPFSMIDSYIWRK